MNTFALILGTVLSLVTLCALRRRTRIDILGLVYLMISLIVITVPIHLAVVGLLGIAILIPAGAGTKATGQLGLSLMLMAGIGLLRVFRRADVARHALEQALLQDPSARSPVIERVPVAPTERVPAWLRVAHYSRPNVKVIRKLSYGEAGVRNELDVFMPMHPPAQKMPVLIQIHGSGWSVSSKDHQGLPLLYYMAQRGWIGVAINYRLSPAARFPDHLIDVKKAIAWVRAHIAQYGGDPAFIALTGGSAGGHLASLAALLPNRPELQPGFESADTQVAAVVPVYARLDFDNRCGHDKGSGGLCFLRDRVMPPDAGPDLWDLASPMVQVHRDAPPFFVIHPTHDSLIPVEEAREFVARLRAVSRAPVLFAEVFGAQHAYDVFHSPWTGPTVKAIHHFLEARFIAFTTRAATATTGGHANPHPPS